MFKQDISSNVYAFTLGLSVKNAKPVLALAPWVTPKFIEIWVSYSALFTFWSGCMPVLLAYPWVTSFGPS